MSDRPVISLSGSNPLQPVDALHQMGQNGSAR